MDEALPIDTERQEKYNPDKHIRRGSEVGRQYKGNLMNHTIQNWLNAQITSLKEQNLYKPLVVMDSPSGARITVNGKPGVINLSSNNYLGLANHPKLKEAAI